jgi:phage portal protein BeeE
LKHEKTLSEGAAKRLKENWLSLYSGDHRGSPAVLEEGLDVDAIDQLSPEDAELLAARRFTIEKPAAAHFGRSLVALAWTGRR